MAEFWLAGVGNSTVDGVVTAEAAGWDGHVFMDSQSLGPDPYVFMGACAMRTERIKLAPGVTNPLTRHIAVTAAGMATLQALSGGRAALGIGRGDSALAYVGYGPVRLPAFQRALEDLQTLLSGGKLAMGDNAERPDAPLAESLSLGDRPQEFGLKWLSPHVPKTPLDVAATGPKVIEMAATIAEAVTFSVGAVTERIDWALDIARTARSKRGLPTDCLSYGAQIIVVCHRDRDTAIEQAAAAVPNLGRFQVIQGAPAGPIGEGDAANYAAIRKGYDMNKHDKTQATKIVGGALSRDFIDRFAIAGPPEHCIERLLPLIRLGLDRVVIVGPALFPDGGDGPHSLFASEVMPEVRKELAG